MKIGLQGVCAAPFTVELGATRTVRIGYYRRMRWLGLLALSGAIAVGIGCSSDSETSGSGDGGSSEGDGGAGNATGGNGGTTGSGGDEPGASGAATGGNATGGNPAGGGPGAGGTPGAGGAIGAGGASDGGAPDGGRPGAGGGGQCPPTCFVANECVTACGEEPRNYGCCPCPRGTINVLSCRGDAGDGVSCDRREVFCRRAEPVCAEGMVASVEGTCWGPCVPIDSCVCSGPESCPNEEIYTCHNSRGRCGPYVF